MQGLMGWGTALGSSWEGLSSVGAAWERPGGFAGSSCHTSSSGVTSSMQPCLPPEGDGGLWGLLIPRARKLLLCSGGLFLPSNQWKCVYHLTWTSVSLMQTKMGRGMDGGRADKEGWERKGSHGKDPEQMRSVEIRSSPAFPSSGQQEWGREPGLPDAFFPFPSFPFHSHPELCRAPCQGLVGRGTSLPAPVPCLHPGSSSESRKLISLN